MKGIRRDRVFKVINPVYSLEPMDYGFKGEMRDLRRLMWAINDVLGDMRFTTPFYQLYIRNLHGRWRWKFS